MTPRGQTMTDWRSQKRQARVTLAEVQNALHQLKLQGIQNPSLRAIRSVIGRGSLDKINALKKQLNDTCSLIEDNKKDDLEGIKDVLKDTLTGVFTNNLKDVYRRLDNLEGQLSLNLEDAVELEADTALGELRQLWLEAVFKYQVLESKLEAVQSDAQVNIDSLTQKLDEAKQENERLASEYNQLHEKYAALKMNLDDGNAPVKATSRKPLTLDGEAEYIIDTDKAKERVIELIKEGLDHKEITQQLETEGYRTKGLLGDIKPYLQSNIGKWQRKFKQKGHI